MRFDLTRNVRFNFKDLENRLFPKLGVIQKMLVQNDIF